jgi:hypothetical protein
LGRGVSEGFRSAMLRVTGEHFQPYGMGIQREPCAVMPLRGASEIEGALDAPVDHFSQNVGVNQMCSCTFDLL